MPSIFSYDESQFGVDATPNGVNLPRLEQEIRDSDITIALDHTVRSNSTIIITFKANLPTADKVLLDGDPGEPPPYSGIVGAHSGIALESAHPTFQLSSQQADGVPKFAIAPRLGKETVYATHNFCDATTWYSESTRVVDGALTDIKGDGFDWEGQGDCWIDLERGNVFDEDGIIIDQQSAEPGDPHGYGVVVKVDGVTMTQRPPFSTEGGDYEVEYKRGRIHFFESHIGSTVTASFSRKNTSGWILKPNEGRVLTIEKAEIQFSADLEWSSTLKFEVFGNVTYFANHLAVSGGGPIPDGTPIPIETSRYKTMAQMLDESVGTFPAFPNIGGIRRIGSAVYILQFHYGVAKQMFSSVGMFMRIGLEANTVNGPQEHSVPLGGSRATGTFYMPSHPDPGPAIALTELASS